MRTAVPENYVELHPEEGSSGQEAVYAPVVQQDALEQDAKAAVGLVAGVPAYLYLQYQQRRAEQRELYSTMHYRERQERSKIYDSAANVYGTAAMAGGGVRGQSALELLKKSAKVSLVQLPARGRRLRPWLALFVCVFLTDWR